MTNKARRYDFQKNKLSLDDVHKDPFLQFGMWWQEALQAKEDTPDAMHLATVDEHGHPNVRVVLLKEFDEHGFVFFTNYQSKKGQELAQNQNAALSFFWPKLERQIRLRGITKKTKTLESQLYFETRPKEAQVSAWVSPQSRVISREELDEAYAAKEKQNDIISCPSFWGGYRFVPTYFEFWQGREHRLHDRICYTSINHEWTINRLAP